MACQSLKRFCCESIFLKINAIIAAWIILLLIVCETAKGLFCFLREIVHCYKEGNTTDYSYCDDTLPNNITDINSTSSVPSVESSLEEVLRSFNTEDFMWLSFLLSFIAVQMFLLCGCISDLFGTYMEKIRSFKDCLIRAGIITEASLTGLAIPNFSSLKENVKKMISSTGLSAYSLVLEIMSFLLLLTEVLLLVICIANVIGIHTNKPRLIRSWVIMNAVIAFAACISFSYYSRYPFSIEERIGFLILGIYIYFIIVTHYYYKKLKKRLSKKSRRKNYGKKKLVKRKSKMKTPKEEEEEEEEPDANDYSEGSDDDDDDDEEEEEKIEEVKPAKRKKKRNNFPV